MERKNLIFSFLFLFVCFTNFCFFDEPNKPSREDILRELASWNNIEFTSCDQATADLCESLNVEDRQGFENLVDNPVDLRDNNASLGVKEKVGLAATVVGATASGASAAAQTAEGVAVGSAVKSGAIFIGKTGLTTLGIGGIIVVVVGVGIYLYANSEEREREKISMLEQTKRIPSKIISKIKNTAISLVKYKSTVKNGKFKFTAGFGLGNADLLAQKAEEEDKKQSVGGIIPPGQEECRHNILKSILSNKFVLGFINGAMGTVVADVTEGGLGDAGVDQSGVSV